MAKAKMHQGQMKALPAMDAQAKMVPDDEGWYRVLLYYGDAVRTVYYATTPEGAMSVALFLNARPAVMMTEWEQS